MAAGYGGVVQTNMARAWQILHSQQEGQRYGRLLDFLDFSVSSRKYHVTPALPKYLTE